MSWLLFHLRVAYSTEIGAASAYRGHARATRDPAVAAYILGIEQDERHHRAAVGELLEAFGARPFYPLELLFWVVGNTIGLGCFVWGEWASAFGAAQFEFGGMGDYRRAARAARAVGEHELAARLEVFEQQEAAHRAFFLALARSRLPIGARPLDLAEHPIGARVLAAAPCGHDASRSGQ